MSDRDKAVLETKQFRKTKIGILAGRVWRWKNSWGINNKRFWADRRDKWRADGSLNQRDPEVERVLNS